MKVNQQKNTMKNKARAVVLSGCVMTSVLFTGCGGLRDTGNVQGDSIGQTGSPGQSTIQDLTADVPSAVYDYVEGSTYDGVQHFSKELLAQSLDDTNPVLSPVSAYLAMSLAGSGARGQTAEEFDHVMGVNRQAVSEELMTSFPAETEGTQVFLANSAWIDEAMQCENDWLSMAVNSYKADVYQTRLASQDAMDSINAWVDRNTKGLIKNFLQQPMSDETRLALFNTVYFKGKWAQEFEVTDNRTTEFTRDDGTEVPVRMMSKYDEELPYVKSEFCDGIVLPYQDSDLKFVALKPTDAGMTVREMYDRLDMAQIGQMVDGAKQTRVDLWLPKFEVTFDRTMNDDMIEMGLNDAFDSGSADFTGISGKGRNALYISLVRQKAVFIVDEKGTEAAAVTMVAMDESCMEPQITPLEVHFDRPYVYMILDPETDVPLFMGIMDDPSLAQKN